jgi:hypothetical protein
MEEGTRWWLMDHRHKLMNAKLHIWKRTFINTGASFYTLMADDIATTAAAAAAAAAAATRTTAATQSAPTVAVDVAPVSSALLASTAGRRNGRKCDECANNVNCYHRRPLPNFALKFQYGETQKEADDDLNKLFNIITIDDRQTCNVCWKEVKENVPHLICKPDICGWCGRTENTDFYRFAPSAYWYNIFCAPHYDTNYHKNTRNSSCYYRFGQFEFSFGRDLRYGIPAIYKLTLGHLMSFERTVEEKYLRCDFCGTEGKEDAGKAGSVIKCPYLPPYFLHTNFCMNKKCCNAYYTFMTSNQVIPYSMRQEINRHLNEKQLQIDQLVYESDEESYTEESKCSNSVYNCFFIDTLRKTLVKRMKAAQVTNDVLCDSQFFFREKECIKRNRLLSNE